MLQFILAKLIARLIKFPYNKYHPLVLVLGNPQIGENTYVGAFSEINAKNSSITIGKNCDIASFVSINCADSHRKVLGREKYNTRREIEIGNNVFIGSHSMIKGGARIGDYCVVAAGTVVEGVQIQPFSLIYGNPMKIKNGYYRE